MPPLPSLPSRLVLSLLPLCLASCELTEVTVAEGEPRIIVQSVISNSPSQFVIVERSLTGRHDGSSASLPGGRGFPIEGAQVSVRNDGPSACGGTAREFGFTALDGTYVGFLDCPPQPGDHLRLRVVTPDGDSVLGSTTVPGARHVSIRLATDSATVVGQILELDRQRDTLRIAVDPILARAMQVEVRFRDDPDEIAVYLFTDTLGVALPGDLINPFEGEDDEGKPVFEVGQEYALTVAVTDTNYYDFVRSRSDPFTGRGFLNHLDGGIGVFGSVEAYTYYIRVVR
jgi:Domain of unknown function (DUF4249)